MSSNPDEDIDWEDWLRLSDAQQDAQLAAAMADYNRMTDAMTPLECYRYQRGRTLSNLVKSSRICREMPGLEVFQKMRRRQQHRLLKLRIELRTGHYPGTA